MRCVVSLGMLAFTSTAFGQVNLHQSNWMISSSPYSTNVHVGGLLDGEITFTRTSDGGFTKAFDPNVSLSMTNIGSTNVVNPRLVFNNKGNWYDVNLLRDEVLSGAVTPKEKALAIWKFLRDNRIHRDKPEEDPSWEGRDPIRLLGVYGYGWCGDAAAAIAAITFQAGYPTRFWVMSGHVVSESNFGQGYMLIDGDIETFGLKSDNSSLAGKSDITQDRNLIRRTKTYGKYSPRDSLRNEIVASNYNETSSFTDRGYTFDSYDIYGFQRDATLNFTLRPNESINYDYSYGTLTHALADEGNPPKPNEFANGIFVYQPPFQTILASQLVDSLNNVKSFLEDGKTPILHAATVGSAASFVIRVSSPFVIVDGMVQGFFERTSLSDSLSCYFSRDGITWTPIWSSSQTGIFQDSVSLTAPIATKSLPALYSYYLKFAIFSSDSITSCGIDSLLIRTKFQVSRFFLPSLHLGDNMISYTDATSSSRNLAVSVAWNESSDNHPPQAPSAAIFPPNNGSVDSLQLTFQWSVPSDPDGDSIADYEFELADRPDMKYPFTPSFNQYVSTLVQPVVPLFRVPREGLMNDGTAYYWHVRAKDSKGAWSKWSPVWSFTPHGIMMPIVTGAVINDTAIILNWSRNSIGYAPLFYEIHSSNETNGFTPSNATLLDTTSNSYFAISLRYDSPPKAFYRVIAVASDARKSGPSDVIAIPHPMVLNQMPRVSPGQPYSSNLIADSSWTRRWTSSGLLTAGNNTVISALSLPPWLSFDASRLTLSGQIDSLRAHKVLFDTTLNTIQLSLNDQRGGITQQTIRLRPVYVDNAPVFSSQPNVQATEDSTYTYKAFASDSDTLYGDLVHYRPVVLPSWLRVDSVSGLISGIPRISNVHDTTVTIDAFDRVGSVARQNYTIHVQHVNHPPIIVSVAVFHAAEDTLYRYQVSAVDPDTLVGDVLSYSLTRKMIWLSINATTGLMSGIPRGVNVGDSVVTVQVSDGKGGTARESYTLSVTHTNHAPVIVSITDTMATEDTLYTYRVRATDVDSALFGDKVHFAMTVRPSWMTIDSVTGVIQGTASGLNARDTTATVMVYDNKGGVVSQRYTLHVKHINHPPVIVSSAVSQAREDSVYQYTTKAVDPDSLFGDVQRYSLVVRPSWLTIDSVSGNVSGLPRGSSVGDTTIVVRVSDGKGGIASQGYILTVHHTNHAPVFVSSPDTVAFEDSSYSFRPYARDQDSVLFGDRVTYTFVVKPACLQIDSSTGLVRGLPRAKDVGDTVVILGVYDGKGGVALQHFTLHVRHTNHPPVFVSSAPATAKADSVYWYQIAVTDPDAQFGDSIRCRLVTGPHWLLLAPDGRSLLGIPGTLDVGDTSVVLQGDDGKGSKVLQSYSLHISPVLPNTVTPSFVLPVPGFQLTLERPAKPLTFIWQGIAGTITGVASHAIGTESKVADKKNHAAVALYSLHIRGTGLDTTISNVQDTVLSANIMQRLAPSSTYEWSLGANISGSDTALPATFTFITSSGFSKLNLISSLIPNTYILYQNFPNPFNNATVIRFGLPAQSRVSVKVFNILGQIVANVLDDVLIPGYHQLYWEPQSLSSGAYIIVMQASSISNDRPGFRNIKKIIYLK